MGQAKRRKESLGDDYGKVPNVHYQNSDLEITVNTKKLEKEEKFIYVYTMWNLLGGYWILDTPENRERINDSDSYFWNEGGPRFAYYSFYGWFPENAPKIQR